MKKTIIIFLLLLTIFDIRAQEKDFPELTGPYLGQTPPVNEPVRFAPGIVGGHSSVTISTDGKEIYWSRDDGKIWFTVLKDGKWKKPEMVSFCKGNSYDYDNPFLTPDGSKMFLTSFRPGGYHKNKEAIWYAERSPTGWLEPKKLGPAVNETPLHWSISVSDSGTLYFGGRDIYCSKLISGKYQKPVSIDAINTSATETCPYIAPDESYIVFTRFDETNVKNTGIFISYKDQSGNWLPPILALGGDRKSGGLSPRISPDGKYLFYVNGGMWWRPATFIKELRQKE